MNTDRKQHPPNRIREWRVFRDLSLDELGKVLGIGRSAMSHKELSKSPVTTGELEKLADKLRCSPDDLLKNAPAPNLHSNDEKLTNYLPRNQDIHPSITRSKIPVYGAAAAGNSQQVILTEDNIIGYDFMPDELEGVIGALKILVKGDSMENRYFDGEKVHCHPYKPPHIGQDCVYVEEPDGNAFVKKFAGETPTEWKFTQYNPPKTFSVKKTKVRKIYSVTGRS